MGLYRRAESWENHVKSNMIIHQRPGTEGSITSPGVDETEVFL